MDFRSNVYDTGLSFWHLMFIQRPKLASKSPMEINRGYLLFDVNTKYTKSNC